MKLNKWVKENGKWSEYKCTKFNSDSNSYMSVLNNASRKTSLKGLRIFTQPSTTPSL